MTLESNMAANNSKLHFVTTGRHRISLKINIQGLLSMLNPIFSHITSESKMATIDRKLTTIGTCYHMVSS